MSSSTRPKIGGAGTDSVAERLAPSVASTTYRELAAIFERYISPMLVHSTLRTVLAQRGATPGSLRRDEAPTFVESAMTGMRLFCDPARLGALTAEVESYLAQPGPPSTSTR